MRIHRWLGITAVGLSVLLLFLIAVLPNQIGPAEEDEVTDSQVIIFYTTPQCGCCTVYAEALDRFTSETGVSLEVVKRDADFVSSVKRDVGVPDGLWSCHTMILGDYFMEGHVPLDAIEWLLTAKPDNVHGIVTLHSDAEMDPNTWMGTTYRVVYTNGDVEGPLSRFQK